MRRPCYARLLAFTVLLHATLLSAQEREPKVSDLTKEQQEKLKEVDALAIEFKKLIKDNRITEAVAALEKAIRLTNEIFGPEHPHVEANLKLLALISETHSKWDSSKRAREALVEHLSKKYGKDDWRVVDARWDLRNVATFQKLSLDEKARLREANEKNAQGARLFGAGKADEAAKLFEEGILIREQVLGSKHPLYALSLNNLGTIFEAQGEYRKAEPLFEKALAIRKESLGEKHPEYAQSLNDLAVIYQHLGLYTEAEPLQRQAVELRRVLLGDNHPNYATSLANLGTLYQNQNKYSMAEPLSRQALEIRKAVLGTRHPEYALSVNNLAVLYDLQGQYAKAEPLLREALQIRKEVLGEKHPDYARSLATLAVVHYQQGQLVTAERQLRDALEIMGERHPEYSTNLNNLAMLYERQGLPQKAEPLLRQALEICKKRMGDKHPEYATSLNNLAMMYDRHGKYAEAESLYREALSVIEKTLGKKHSNYAGVLHNLASVSIAQKEYEKAERYCRQVLAIRKHALGDKHPDYANDLNTFAMLHDFKGEPAKAEPLFLQAIQIDRELLDRTASIQSERQQLVHAHRLRIHIDNLCRCSKDQDTDPARVYAALLAWKGTIAARQRQTRLVRTLLQNQPDGETAQLLEDLETVGRQLAALMLAQPDPQRQTDIPARTQELAEKHDRLEKELSAKTGAFRQLREIQQLTPSDLQRLLPDGTVLVDFFEYGANPTRPDKAQMLAFVIAKDRITRVDFGKVQTLARSVREFRGSLARRTRPVVDRDDPALTLRSELWGRLEKHLAGANLVLLSPDGPLNDLPFAALPGKDETKFLIEEIALAMLPVPQLLPELLKRPAVELSPAAASALLVGGVDFDGDVAHKSPSASAWAARSGTLNSWRDLPGSAREVEALAKMFGERFSFQPTLLQKSAASEDAVRRQIGKHRWVHLATHGFFTPAGIKSVLDRDLRIENDRPIGVDPRLLSGIVLAGANRRPEIGRDDGILTALEIGDLDLAKVDLAVLSACETGLGEVAGGEGVLGLQRAFQTAGASAVVTSLWQIPDEPTRILMERFYENLWKGRDGKKFSRLEALRKAQIWMLNKGKSHPGVARGLIRDDLPQPEKNGRLPPYYWAAFVLSGDWR